MIAVISIFSETSRSPAMQARWRLVRYDRWRTLVSGSLALFLALSAWGADGASNENGLLPAESGDDAAALDSGHDNLPSAFEDYAAEDTGAHETFRDPFWPIGYTPGEPESEMPTQLPAAPIAPEAAPVVWPELRVRAFAQTERGRVALIDGVGLVSKGQTARRRVGPHVFEWLIVDVTDAEVVHQRIGVRPATARD